MQPVREKRRRTKDAEAESVRRRKPDDSVDREEQDGGGAVIRGWAGAKKLTRMEERLEKSSLVVLGRGTTTRLVQVLQVLQGELQGELQWRIRPDSAASGCQGLPGPGLPGVTIVVYKVSACRGHLERPVAGHRRAFLAGSSADGEAGLGF